MSPAYKHTAMWAVLLFVTVFLQNCGCQGTVDDDNNSIFLFAFFPEATETHLFLTSCDPGSCDVSYDDGKRKSVTVKLPGGNVLSVDMSGATTLPFGVHVENKAILINCTVPASAYAYNYGHSYATTDAYTGLPIKRDYTEYLVPSAQMNAVLGIAALESGTHVFVTLNSTCDYAFNGTTYKSGDTFSLDLKALDVLGIGKGSDRDNQVMCDLGGTTVSSNKPVAVYSGSTSLIVKDDGGHAMSQILPTRRWSKEFVVPSPQGDALGHVVRVTAGLNDTTINIGVPGSGPLEQIHLDAGERYEREFQKEHVLVSSDKPVQVTQYVFTYFHSFENAVPGTDTYEMNYTATTMDRRSTEYDDFVNVVTTKDCKDDIVVEGKAPASLSWSDLDSSNYTVGSATISPGPFQAHSKSGNCHFYLQVYGFGKWFGEAYGYSTALGCHHKVTTTTQATTATTYMTPSPDASTQSTTYNTPPTESTTTTTTTFMTPLPDSTTPTTTYNTPPTESTTTTTTTFMTPLPDSTTPTTTYNTPPTETTTMATATFMTPLPDSTTPTTTYDTPPTETTTTTTTFMTPLPDITTPTTTYDTPPTETTTTTTTTTFMTPLPDSTTPTTTYDTPPTESTTTLKSTTLKPEELLESAVNFTCTPEGWNIAVDLDLLKRLFPNLDPDLVFLSDNMCQGKKEDPSVNVIRFDFNYGQCLTTTEETKDEIIFKNFLFYPEVTGSVIQAIDWQYDLICHLARNEIEKIEYNPHAQVKLHAHGSGTVKGHEARLTFFNDSAYQNEIQGNPLNIGVGSNTYAQLTIPDNEGEKMVVKECNASPAPSGGTGSSPGNVPVYPLIQDKCATDKSTTILNSTHTMLRFSFKALEFLKQHGYIFVSCNVHLCTEDDTTADCQQTCSHK